MKNILGQKKKINHLFSKPKSGLADLWSRMVAKLRILGSKTFLRMYFNNNLRHFTCGCDGMLTLSLYMATRPNLSNPPPAFGVLAVEMSVESENINHFVGVLHRAYFFKHSNEGHQ